MTHDLLNVQNISKKFYLGKQLLHVVNNVSFSLFQGEILGLGGESGCGKSTLAKLLIGLLKPSAGSIYFDGQDLTHGSKSSKAWRRKIQMVFQHPATSLNPRFTVAQALSEPFTIHKLLKGEELFKRMIILLEQVGLSKDYLTHFPSELSGGQIQRIAIARALALDPRLLIFDEPFASLDVTIQAQIIKLLIVLHQEKQFSYLLISHDLSVLRYMTHQLAIMYLGEIVEWGPTEDVYNHSQHPYTQALVSAVLLVDPSKKHLPSKIILKEETTPLMPTQQGCPFASRCPRAQHICRSIKPVLRELKAGHFVSCHQP